MSDGTDMDGMTGDAGDEILAAEYVLHLLEPAERRAAEDRMAVDGGFRARVDDWSEAMVRMAEGIAPVAPPAALRARIAERVAPEPAMARTRGRSGARRNWLRGLLGAGLALAAVLAVVAVVLPVAQGPEEGERYAADIAAEDRALEVTVRYDATDNVLVIRKLAGTVPEGRDLEVWLLTEDQPPHSVGTLPDAEEMRIDVSPFWGQRIPSGSFAVSEEPAGGSPTGLPTGEVIAVAPVSGG